MSPRKVEFKGGVARAGITVSKIPGNLQALTKVYIGPWEIRMQKKLGGKWIF